MSLAELLNATRAAYEKRSRQVMAAPHSITAHNLRLRRLTGPSRQSEGCYFARASFK
jgi:hypothetical protein